MEAIWLRISTFVGFPNEVARALIDREDEDAEVYCTVHHKASRWAVALADAWSRSTVWTTAFKHVEFSDLFDRLYGDEELQQVVEAAYRSKAQGFEILTLVHDWRKTNAEGSDQGVTGCDEGGSSGG